MKFTFIAAQKAWAPVAVLCKVLEVSRSGFYAWDERGRSTRSSEDAKLAVHILAAFKTGRGGYGSPRVQEELLKADGIAVSRKRVARIMRELGLVGRRKRRFKATTDSKHNLPVAENVLDRNFEVDAPDVAWVTDITYVWTAEGWLYLAAILDLFSRRVVGFAMSQRIDRALVLEALRAAVGRRVPNAGLMHHSDRGSQLGSDAGTRADPAFTQALHTVRSAPAGAANETGSGTARANPSRVRRPRRPPLGSPARRLALRGRRAPQLAAPPPADIRHRFAAVPEVPRADAGDLRHP